MLIPRFTLSQDPKTVTITLVARHCKLRELEYELSDNCFMFSCWPYYLRINLPGNLVDDDNVKSSYNVRNGEFIFCYKKAIEGEIFEDLDFITKFLVKEVDASYGYETEEDKIVVISEDNMEEEDAPSPDDLSYFLTFGFGFALLGSTQLKALHAEYFDVFKVDPFQVKIEDRRKLRLKEEDLKFNSDHYLADLFEFQEIEQVMNQIVPWENLDAAMVSFTGKELDFLKELKNKTYKLSSAQENFARNTLVDILYAYCYDKRVTWYEENSESGWNITTVGASLSWLDVFETPREALVFAFRRSLIYPLYRNFELNMKILEDLKKLLMLGEKFIIKCLIEINQIFLKGDCCRYILNTIFIKDYINYVMKWDKNKWQECVQSVYETDIKKADLGLNLEAVEKYETLLVPMATLEIKDGDSDDTSDEDSYDDESDSSDSSNSSESSDSSTESN